LETSPIIAIITHSEMQAVTMTFEIRKQQDIFLQSNNIDFNSSY
jgi:hypothetical protein